MLIHDYSYRIHKSKCIVLQPSRRYYIHCVPGASYDYVQGATARFSSRSTLQIFSILVQAFKISGLLLNVLKH